MARQLTIHQLLEDRVYSIWLDRTPKLSVVGNSKPWRIYAKKKKKGPWLRAEFSTYEKALAWMKANLDDYYDIVINSKRQAYPPPSVKKDGKVYHWPTPAKHIWCPYCRRPTFFLFFTAHHAFRGKNAVYVDEYKRRCSVCGVALDFIKQYPSKLVSNLDSTAKKGK